MKEALTFDYKGKQVRTIEQDGETWWVLKDVCEILGLKNSTMIAGRLDEDERAKFDLGRQGETNIINESGLYNVILRSDKPEAKPFRKWVTSEVLPSIRRTGNYISNPSQTETAIIALAGQMGNLTGQMGRLTEMVMGLYAERQPAPQAQPERQSLPEQIMMEEIEDRELRGAKELLQRFQLGCGVVEFNKLLLEKGYMEQRVFPRIWKEGERKINVLTEKGLPYGKNARCLRSQKGAQPRYYADSFLILYKKIME